MPRHERFMGVYYTYGTYHSMPLIRLQGKWLRDAGFQIGDRVRVEVLPEQIIIRKAGDESKENYA